MAKAKVCCICGKPIKGYGCNPEGAMWRNRETGDIESINTKPGDKCCDECNTFYVIPGRRYKDMISKLQNSDKK